jgi:N-acetyl-gamma-glutamylphosphate reductase
MNKIKVGIIGGTGYTGVELLRLLHNHPKAEVIADEIVALSFEFFNSQSNTFFLSWSTKT